MKYEIRYDTTWDAILTSAGKPTWVSLIYRTEPTTKSVQNRKTKSRKQICSEITEVDCLGNPCSESCSVRSAKMWLLATDVAWSVCVSVCLSVCLSLLHNGELCWNTWTNREQGRTYIEARILFTWPLILHVTRSDKGTKDIIRHVSESPNVFGGRALPGPTGGTWALPQTP